MIRAGSAGLVLALIPIQDVPEFIHRITLWSQQKPGFQPRLRQIARSNHQLHRCRMLIQTCQSLHGAFLHSRLQVSVANFA
jgi:hypothetical protein